MAEKEPSKSEIEAVTSLLFPDDEPAAAEMPQEPDPEMETAHEESGDQPEPRAEMPDDLKSLAEQLGVKVKDLYQVKIGMPEGESPITIGELKDRVKELRTADSLKQELEDQRAEIQRERLQFEREFDVLRQFIKEGRAPTDEELQQAAEAHSQRIQRRDAEILKIAPHLQEKEAQLKVVKAAEQWGIPAQVLASFPLPGLALALDRLATLEGRLAEAREAKAKPKAQRPTGAPAKPQGAARTAQLKSKVAAGQMDKVAAVAELLGG